MRGVAFSLREEEVTGVLLADGWHDVKPGRFFWGEWLYDDPDDEHPAIGYEFRATDTLFYAGPASAVLSLRGACR